jgi:hypothetical protein
LAATSEICRAKLEQERSFQHYEAPRAGLSRGLDAGRELIGRSHLADCKTMPTRFSGAPQLRKRHARKRRIRLEQHRHDPNAGGKLLQDLQPLAANLGALDVETSDVGARPIQASDNARSYWIADAGEHDGYACGRGLRRLGSRRTETSNDHVGIGFDEVQRQLRQVLQVSFGGSEVEDQILAFCITQLGKSFLTMTAS